MMPNTVIKIAPKREGQEKDLYRLEERMHYILSQIAECDRIIARPGRQKGKLRASGGAGRDSGGIWLFYNRKGRSVMRLFTIRCRAGDLQRAMAIMKVFLQVSSYKSILLQRGGKVNAKAT